MRRALAAAVLMFAFAACETPPPWSPITVEEVNCCPDGGTFPPPEPLSPCRYYDDVHCWFYGQPLEPRP